MTPTAGGLPGLLRTAARWLGLGKAPQQHRHTVAGTRGDDTTWTRTRSEAAAIVALESDLSGTGGHSEELMRDLFLLAFKSAPRIRDAGDVLVSRLPNRAVVAALAETPEYRELHRHTVADRYASAMALLAQADTIRDLAADAASAQQAAEAADAAARQARDAAAAVAAAAAAAESVAASGGDSDPDDPAARAAAAALAAAVATASAADDDAADARGAAACAAADLAGQARPALRSAAAQAAEAAEAERRLLDAWQVPAQEVGRMSFRERSALAQRLRSGRLGSFADLVGRFRLTAAGLYARRSDHGHDEVVGVGLGDDLTRLVPSELPALATPVLRAQFAARFAEAQLMVYDTVGTQRVGRGAIIACIDCSYSMTTPHPGPGGAEVTREAWAKACGLALLDQAGRQHRDFVAVLFSSSGDIDIHRFPAGSVPLLDQVLAMTDSFAGHGTDFQTPLSTAADMVAESYNRDHTARADIVLITDGDTTVTDSWLTGWDARKTGLGFRVFAIAIHTVPTATLTALADHLTVVDHLVPAAAKDLLTLV